jgi:hypothetical protein
MMAFKVGSVPADSVYKCVTRCVHVFARPTYDDSVTDIVPIQDHRLSSNTELSALIAWAETFLGLRYSVGENFYCVIRVIYVNLLCFGCSSLKKQALSPYIVPSLVDLDFGVTARWLTDVVALHPACVWSKTNVSGVMDYRPSNISSLFQPDPDHFSFGRWCRLKVRPSFCTSSYIFCLPGILMLSIYAPPSVLFKSIHPYVDAELMLSNHTNQAQS